MSDPRRSRPSGESGLSADLAGLREPLDDILGRVHQLLACPLPTESRTQADAIRRGARSLLARIGSLRDRAELESGILEIREIAFSPAVTLRAEVDRLRPLAVGEGLDLSFELDEAVPERLMGDVSRIRQVLEELVRFSIDRTTHGSVQVRGSWSGEALVLIVEDTGAAPERERLERALGDTTARHSLAFARELAELMGGRIRASSRPGVGSKFRVEIPLETEGPGTDPLERGDLNGTRVLLLTEEDAELQETVESFGARTLVCRSTTQALRRLRVAAEEDDAFELVVASPPFAGPDTLTFGALVKGDVLLRGTRLVMLAAAGRPGDAGRLEEVGWGGYLSQPVPADLLRLGLEVVLGTQRLSSGVPFVTRHVLAEYRMEEPASERQARRQWTQPRSS